MARCFQRDLFTRAEAIFQQEYIKASKVTRESSVFILRNRDKEEQLRPTVLFVINSFVVVSRFSVGGIVRK